jgi:hypothetical protein
MGTRPSCLDMAVATAWLHFFADTQRLIASRLPFTNPREFTQETLFVAESTAHPPQNDTRNAKQLPYPVGKSFPTK